MTYLVLGPLEVTLAGAPADLGPPKQRAVLAMLLLNAPQPVPTRRLVDGLWPDNPPPSAVKNVQVYVYQLRRVLGRTLTSVSAGYRLDPGTDMDLADFQRKVSHARHTARAGDLATAVDRYRRALALWRGPALADLTSRDLLLPQAAHLDHCRLTALDECLDLELRLGRHHQILAELDQHVAEHPLHEPLRRHQLRALHSCGRHTEAIAAYQKMCDLFALELGAKPAPATRQLARVLELNSHSHCASCGHPLR